MKSNQRPCPAQPILPEIKDDELPPLPPNESAVGCAHKFIHIETVYRKAGGGYRMVRYWRVDRFYCEHCLEPREIQKEELSERQPEWWRPLKGVS